MTYDLTYDLISGLNAAILEAQAVVTWEVLDMTDRQPIIRTECETEARSSRAKGLT